MNPVSVLVRVSCISFLVGITCATVLLDRVEGAFFVVIFGVVGLALVALGTVFERRVALILGCMLVGFWYLPFRTSALDVALPPTREFVGTIHIVEQQEEKIRLVVGLTAPEILSGKSVFVYVDRYAQYRSGESIVFSCELRPPERFDTFAFDRYAERRSVVGMCTRPKVQPIDGGDPVRMILGRIRSFYARQYMSALPNDEAELLKAMVLNMTGTFPDALRDRFTASGLTHSISVSGLHMSLLIVMVSVVVRSLGVGVRTQVLILVIGFSLYLILLGFPSPAVRSSIMGIATVVGAAYGRRVHSLHSLVLTATILVIQNPLIVGFDIGFQLSCLALLGMALTNEWWLQMFRWAPDRFGARQVFAASFSAQMYTWPLTLYYFGTFSIIAPIANLFILPLFPFVLSMAFLAPVVTAVPILYPVAMLFLGIGTKLINGAVTVFSTVPFAAYTISTPSWSIAASMALVLVPVTYAIRRQRTYP